jgi:hypothetical protein
MPGAEKVVREQKNSVMSAPVPYPTPKTYPLPPISCEAVKL